MDQATFLKPDFVIANGDFALNTDCVGVSDDAAFESAQLALTKLRTRFGSTFRPVFGDHEIGKLSFFGGRGGLRIASFHRAYEELGIEPFWQLALGKYILIGIVSSLVALPVYVSETLADERNEWNKLRASHLRTIREAFSTLEPDQRVLLFCHDPTALPFLWAEESVRNKLPQIEQTIIGHLHSNLVLRQSRLLSGLPRITFLGNTARRLSTALREVRHWRPFNIRLCPALSGIELIKDGGFHTALLDLEANKPIHFQFHPIPRD